MKVRICGTDGQCTDGETDLSDEDFDKYFRHQKDIKIKDGKIYQNGELIGTYQRLSCDEFDPQGAKDSDEVIITESVIDAAALWSAHRRYFYRQCYNCL